MIKKHNRRIFLSEMGAFLTFPSLILTCSSQDNSPTQLSSKSRVVIARHKDFIGINSPAAGDIRSSSSAVVSSGTGSGKVQPSHGSVNFAQTSALLDEAMRALSDKKDSLDPWRALFSSTDVVGIKLNTLGGRMLSPRPDLVEAIAERLVQAGVSPSRILIWDRLEQELKRAGFPPGDFKGKAKVIATDSKGVGYDDELQNSGAIGSCFSRIVSTLCTAIINVGMVKDHDLAGTSVAMKNHFGLIHNPNKYHLDLGKESFIPDLCLHPYIKNKLRLTICDGFTAQYDGGPVYKSQHAWTYGGILVSKDQVALDAVAADVVEKKRHEEKFPALKEAGREPLYIQLAEAKKLGWADFSKIEIKEVMI